jgi:hypothetical protein
MALTPLPPAPNSNSPSTFAAVADTFVAALGNMVTEINGQGSTPVGITPNFQATLSGGVTLTSGSIAQVNWDTEAFDVGSIYDSVTNHQCNMTVAGKYHFDVQIHITATTITSIEVAIENSGSSKVARQTCTFSGTVTDAAVNLAAFIQSVTGTQTARVFVTVVGTGTITLAAANSSFSGYFVAP